MHSAILSYLVTLRYKTLFDSVIQWWKGYCKQERGVGSQQTLLCTVCLKLHWPSPHGLSLDPSYHKYPRCAKLPGRFFGGSTIPFFLVFIRCPPILNIAFLCIDHGLAANLLHWCIACVMSGLVSFSKKLSWPSICLYPHGILLVGLS